jgi:hypothetical protein
MPRAYLRLDPHVYDRKVLGVDRHGAPIEDWEPYPTDALVAFFGVLALADEQSPRGHFRSERILRELLRGADGRGARYARQVPLLIARGDLLLEPGGRLYVDGWVEWQEGDIPPAARMAALARRHGEETDVTPGALRQRRYRERHSAVSHASQGPDHVTRNTVEAEAEAYSNSGGDVTEAEAGADNGAPATFMGYRPKKPKMTQAEALADIERQHAASLTDALAKAKAKEAVKPAPAPTARPRSRASA